MSGTNKPMSQKDADQVLRQANNDVNATLAVDGFLVGAVGRRVDQTISTTTVSGDTSTFVFSENGTNLYTIKVVYTDGTQTTLLYAVRTA